MVDVVTRFLRVERGQVIADRDPLPQLLEFGRGQLIAETGLADEHDLQQLGLFRLQVREHPQFFEGGGTEVLRLVDHQQHQPARQALVDQVLREVADEDWLGSSGDIEPEIERDRLEQLARLEHRVDDAPDSRVAVEAPQQCLQERRLPGSDFTGDDDEAGLRFQAVAQIAERFLMHPARYRYSGSGLSENGRSRS